MLFFEVIIQVFEDILRQDPLYEVVSTTHSYTLLHGSHAESSGTVQRFWKHQKSCYSRVSMPAIWNPNSPEMNGTI